MRSGLILLFTLFVGTSLTYAQSATQIDQSRNSCSDYLKAKKGLEDMVKHIEDEYGKYPLFIKKFRKAQDEWMSYRDAQLEMLYPEADKGEYGTFYPTCRCNWLVEFTNQRLDFLVKFVSNTNEGESCGGAVNSKKRKSYTTFNQ
jgi:uncharacterized protein YecT (DUF1311 family)